MNSTLVTVGQFEDAFAAHLARGRLEAEGISGFVVHEHHVSANWLYSNALGGVRLQVAAEQAEEAKRILADMQTGAYALDPEEDQQPPARCPRCGSQEVVHEKSRWKIAFLSLFLLDIPLPFRRTHRRCRNCGERFDAWQD